MDLGRRADPKITIRDYDDWPIKIVYATDGISAGSLMQHLNSFYAEHSEIPLGRRPNLIHVAGKYVIFRTIFGMEMTSMTGDAVEQPKIGEFRLLTNDPDLQAIIWVLDLLQNRTTASAHILFSYSDLINRINSVT